MWYFSDMHGIELSAHFKLWRYTFSKCQQADIKSRHDEPNFGTTFILSNDGCIFDLKNRVHIHQTDRRKEKTWFLKGIYLKHGGSVAAPNWVFVLVLYWQPIRNGWGGGLQPRSMWNPQAQTRMGTKWSRLVGPTSETYTATIIYTLYRLPMGIPH